MNTTDHVFEETHIAGQSRCVVNTLTGKRLEICNIHGEVFRQKYGISCPTGVRGRNSDNALYRSKIGWAVSQSLRVGMEKTYGWIAEQVQAIEAA